MSRHETVTSPRSATPAVGRRPWSPRPDGVRPPSTRPTTSSRPCPSRTCSRPWTRRRPPRCSPPRPALPRLPHRRPGGARELVDFPDNWIYIHDPDVRTMRIQNFGSWSPYMVKDGRNTASASSTRSGRATTSGRPRRGADRAGQAGARASSGWSRPARSRRLRGPPCQGLPHLRRPLPRQRRRAAGGSPPTPPTSTPSAATACSKYNNQDHSMFTAMLTVENILHRPTHDVWEVNVEEEYHEERPSTSTTRLLAERPRRVGRRSSLSSASCLGHDRARMPSWSRGTGSPLIQAHD
jgi:hypothetical protein